ncbi:MAG: hypothetical protein ACO3E0_01905 [Candidatus Kapaibacteriota bacterium]
MMLRGTIRQCYPVTVIDRELPIDSLIVDDYDAQSPLPDSIQDAVLLGMQSPDVVSGTPNAVGHDIVIRVAQRIDSVLILAEPITAANYYEGRYQLILPIVADTIIVDSTVSALPWNGRAGGVLDLRANSVIIVNDTITATGMGFRGGRRSVNGGSCNIVQPCDVRGSSITAEKGEGYRLPDSTCIAGHLPWGSGGGGGDAHNAGGGGGGNGGDGGRGGDQWRCGGTPGMWGLPGLALLENEPPTRTLGGGGGGGHQNNNAGTDGAPGGGLIRLRTPLITSDSLDTVVILARGGTNATRAGNDGAGGGGGGGTLELRVCSTDSPLQLDVSGGGGGTCDAGHGPGGGGGGGRVIIHPVLLATAEPMLDWIADGGRTGVTSAGDRYGAENGTTGVVELPCSWTSVPTISSNSIARVGDTLSLTIEQIPDVLCGTAITHHITIAGDAVTPIAWDSVGTILRRRQQGDVVELTVLVQSDTSWTIDLLAILGRDTSATISVRSSVSICSWEQPPIVVNVTACALPERRISLTPPTVFQAAVSSDRRISYQVSLPSMLPFTMRLVQVDGRVVWETSGSAPSGTEVGEINGVHLQRGIYILLLSTPWGMERRVLTL